MINIHRTDGTADDYAVWLDLMFPGAFEDVEQATDKIRRGKRKKQVARYQALALWGLARQYNATGELIVELGTYYGFSAAVMKLATPLAWLNTYNPVSWEAGDAAQNLASLDRCTVWTKASWDALAGQDTADVSMVFVDGDHNAVARDVPWFNTLRIGGLILFHDFTPGTSLVHPCEPVYRAVNKLALRLGREPDVLVVEESTFGLAGFYRQEGEVS